MIILLETLVEYQCMLSYVYEHHLWELGDI